MEDVVDRYGTHIVELVDRRATRKVFEFDQILLMPTAAGYRALTEEARIEIKPRIMNYLSRIWSDGAIENLSFFAMAAVVYARSISDPPLEIDVGRVLLKTAAFCNTRCAYRKETGGGCRMAMSESRHQLPKCIKLPREIDTIWHYVKMYIATGTVVSALEARTAHDALRVRAELGHDFVPAASC
jgi:hypothetical protein